jgi:hypothetical protein
VNVHAAPMECWRDGLAGMACRTACGEGKTEWGGVLSEAGGEVSVLKCGVIDKIEADFE